MEFTSMGHGVFGAAAAPRVSAGHRGAEEETSNVHQKKDEDKQTVFVSRIAQSRGSETRTARSVNQALHAAPRSKSHPRYLLLPAMEKYF
ncbi:unnamed protein product [Arctogadus glacialis]